MALILTALVELVEVETVLLVLLVGGPSADLVMVGAAVDQVN